MSDIVKGKIKKLFMIMNQEINEMVNNAYSSKKLTEDITNYVANKLAASSRGYMSSIYTALSDKTLSEPEFQYADHSNKFFDLELDKKMVAAYKFDVNNLPHFNSGMDCKEINRVYSSAAVGVGTATVGGILLGVLSDLIDISIIGTIAGAIIAGLAGFGISYATVVPNINKANTAKAVKAFMFSLEQEMYVWVDDVVAFYNVQVEKLKKTF